MSTPVEEQVKEFVKVNVTCMVILCSPENQSALSQDLLQFIEEMDPRGQGVEVLVIRVTGPKHPLVDSMAMCPEVQFYQRDFLVGGLPGFNPAAIIQYMQFVLASGDGELKQL